MFAEPSLLCIFSFAYSCIFAVVKMLTYIFPVWRCSQYAALNEALKQEVERLRIATGEISAPSETFNLEMQHIPYNQPSFFPQQPQSAPNDSQNVQMPQFHHHRTGMSTQRHPIFTSAQGQGLSDALQQDPLGRFQGLDISSGGSHFVKSEGPSISASESSSTF